ncbi:EXS family protein [Hirsutella rhossiliensis]|uniref:EXS family domain-containing protein n=1 Tax=Hirsutella rhossiliensis TaxID=111463 RepID=A0A9P8N5X0_9HYPO|nr:EXS family domain-containing protein [Hirsutella rhossiliensis]KAH0965232.1 EXS family domain-containing protein [Hirsutella rhossiliensis]
MKFAKELERDAVPEWRIKYLNYKAGKKHIKAVSRALVRTPRPFNSNRAAPSRLHADRTSRGSFSDIISSVRGRPLSEPPPSRHSGELKETESHGDDFELPAPAVHTPADPSSGPKPPTDTFRRNLSRFTTGPVADTFKPAAIAKRSTASASIPQSPSHMRRILAHASNQLTREPSRPDADLQQHQDLVRERERDFYRFMDSELDKVEKFFRFKEEQAGQRLAILREQLHEWRNRRIEEITYAAEPEEPSYFQSGSIDGGHAKSNGWVHPIRAKIFPPGPNSKALRTMPQTPALPPSASGQRRDYVRARHDADVSYRTAKRKLKLALQEFYRSLELLKSYAMLNRTAFRKLNKKFDKAVNARPPLRYMHEKVNRAGFVNSEVLEGHVKAVEDLYSRYFERGNHKLAAGKLRSLSKKSTDESGSSFLNGFLIGTGIVFTTQGLAYGMQLLHDEDPLLRVHTGYLLQIYAGYFMMLLLFSLFCINCFVWTKCKVNYPFIFEFDQRSHIDWRRLAEFPSFFLLLFGIFMWMNFSRYGAERMYLWYPVLLIVITATIIFFPAPVLAYKSRKWFVYAHVDQWRLLLAGIYPVEFRDFFLGDMYCSLTYSMANIELFFCLYSKRFNNPTQCNSSHSRLMGFFLTLPAIWRFLQCLRRYHDTRNVFPHLVNGGKYAMTIVSYVTLSLYRVNGSHTNLALYITTALLNSVYTSIWDLFMDFSLLQPHSRRFLLRDILALKRRWPYYCAMVADPVLRFVWIFYAVFTHNTQHSTFISFMVSLMEVFRRGLWSLFRVENEHCANVAQYKASRDVPLPYSIEPLMARASETSSPVLQTEEQQQQQEELQQQQQQPEQQQSPQQPQNKRPEAKHSNSTAVAHPLGSLRRRAYTTSAQTFSRMIAEAHRQDFEKRRKPPPATESSEATTEQEIVTDDDEDDDDEEATVGLRSARAPRALSRHSEEDE